MKPQTKFKQTEIGKIPEDWEVLKFEKMAFLRHGYQFRQYDFVKKGLKVFKITQIKSDGNIDISSCSFIETSREKEFKNILIKKGDILMALTGATIGKIARVNEDYGLLLQNYRVGNFFPLDEINLSKDFLYYLVSSNIFLNQLSARMTQSAQQNIGKDEINNFLLIRPPIQEQLSISSILSSLDEKIELNNKMNKTLEEIGQALFKKWFIDEKKDEWEEKNIQNILIFEKGVEPGSNCYESKKTKDNIKFIRVGDISQPERNETFIPLILSEDKFCKEEDILLSLDATIGIVRIGMEGAFSGGVRKVYSKKENIPKGYIYFLLKSKEIQEVINTYAQGTTILHAGHSLDYMNMLFPPEKILREFSNIIEPTFNKLVKNLHQNQTLSSIRDTLLPKLMSGEIRVK